MRYELVLWVDDPKPVFTDVESMGMEIKPLIEDYTLGYVTVTPEPGESRVRELEGIIGGNIDQWSEAKDIVERLVNHHVMMTGEIDRPVADLAQLFEID